VAQTALRPYDHSNKVKFNKKRFTFQRKRRERRERSQQFLSINISFLETEDESFESSQMQHHRNSSSSRLPGTKDNSSEDSEH